MEISSSQPAMNAMASSMAQSQTDAAVGVAVLKKSIDLQKEAVGQLLQALPTPAQALPDGVGTRLNVTA